MQWWWCRSRTSRLTISRVIKGKLPLSCKDALLRGNEPSLVVGVLAGVGEGTRGCQKLVQLGEELEFVGSAECCVPGAVLDTGLLH